MLARKGKEEKKKRKRGALWKSIQGMDFCEKNHTKIAISKENKILDSPYLDNRLQTVCQNIVIWLYFCIYLYYPSICHIYSDSGIIFLFGEGNWCANFKENKYGLKKSGDFTVSEGHMHPLVQQIITKGQKNK